MSRLLEALSARFDLPGEAAGAWMVTVTGGARVLVENHGGILSYTDGEVLVGCAGGPLRIRGEGLLLRAMTAETLLVTGRIFGVEQA